MSGSGFRVSKDGNGAGLTSILNRGRFVFLVIFILVSCYSFAMGHNLVTELN